MRMQQQKAKRHSVTGVLGQALVVLLTLLIVSGSSLLVNSSSSAPLGRLPALIKRPAVSHRLITQGATPWESDTQTTAPSFDFFQDGSVPLDTSISPLFGSYYTTHGGAVSLGFPVTAAFHTEYGWMQFFTSGALLLPAVQQKHAPDADDPQPPSVWGKLINAGVRDSGTGILRLPLLQALLSVGSQVPIIARSAFTYVDLRSATASSSMVAASADNHSNITLRTGIADIFVPLGARSGEVVGHQVPLPIWSYIHRADVSPDGWGANFGAPLSEALPLSISINGGIHHLLVQAFWGDAVVLDLSTSNTGQPQISRLQTGEAYLRTLGPPAIMIDPGQPAWAQTDTVLLEAPGASQQEAHIGLDFPMSLLGDTSWKGGVLWYRVRWTSPSGTFAGWVEASVITFTSPGSVPAWASIDALSRHLATYLAAFSGNVGVAIYDVTHQRYYVSGADSQFITGSSIKVPIMLTLLDLTESQGREPDGGEMALLTTMIENSNNDSAAALFHGEVGGAAGVGNYLQRIGINGLDLDPDAFGWSLITPLAMVTLLTKLYEGTILTAGDRDLALSLMEQIEPDQQVGVGDTAPAGATVAMKDGWVVGPDGLWTMNSSGIVTLGSETYIIAVYTQDQNTLEDGQALVQHVCGTVAALLI